MPKYAVYDERTFIIFAENHEAAFKLFTQMNPDELASCEVEGGETEIWEIPVLNAI